MEPKDEIKSRIDVAALIGEYLQIKPAGRGSFKTLCPFHGEKSPSFHISQEKQIWHCFGCDMGGDIFSFVMEMDGLTFPEALRMLGKKAGVEIPEYQNKQVSHSEGFLIDLNELARDYFLDILHKQPEGKIARDYLVERGIDTELAKKFQLGLSPNGWTVLGDVLKKKGFAESRIEKAGLIKPRLKGSGYIDRFRHRLMIPLRDSSGRAVGFTARALAADEKGPKYLNSPETPIYHKSKILFGLAFAKSAIRKERSVIIVEGNLDVIASHKAGVEHIVASSGTALTEDQLLMLKRLTKRLIFCFDSDSAGFAAARRGMHLAQSLDFDVRVISIPKELGKDPDDVVQKNPAAWRDLVDKPVHIMQYYIDRLLTDVDLSDIDVKRDRTHQLLQEIARLKDPIDVDHWLQLVSDLVRIDLDILRGIVVKSRGVSGASSVSGASGVPKKHKNVKERETRFEKAAKLVMGLALSDADLAKEVVGRLEPDSIPEKFLAIYKQFVLVYTAEQSTDSTQLHIFPLLRKHFEDAEDTQSCNELTRIALHAERFATDMKRDQVREELNRHIDILRSAALDMSRDRLVSAIRQAEASGDQQRLAALMEEYHLLIK